MEKVRTEQEAIEALPIQGCMHMGVPSMHGVPSMLVLRFYVTAELNFWSRSLTPRQNLDATSSAGSLAYCATFLKCILSYLSSCCGREVGRVGDKLVAVGMQSRRVHFRRRTFASGPSFTTQTTAAL